MKYIIKHANGTYYRGMRIIGPEFGATKKEALRFTTEREAMMEKTRHWGGFINTEIEAVEK